jgi:hypothetical protein
MALSAKLKSRIRAAITNKVDADEMIAAIESGANPKAAHVANVVAADATDLASAEALANANKVTTNAILAALQAANLMA